MPLSLEFGELGELLAALRGRIGREGMVIKTAKPHPPGTRLDLQVRLKDSLVLLRGEGTVVGASPQVTGGLALRFTRLDPQSSAFVDQLMQRFAAEGLPPFSLEDALRPRQRRPPAESVTQRRDPALDRPLERLPEDVAEHRPRKTWFRLVLLVLVMMVLVAAGVALARRRHGSATPPGTSQPAPTALPAGSPEGS